MISDGGVIEGVRPTAGRCPWCCFLVPLQFKATLLTAFRLIPERNRLPRATPARRTVDRKVTLISRRKDGTSRRGEAIDATENNGKRHNRTSVIAVTGHEAVSHRALTQPV